MRARHRGTEEADELASYRWSGIRREGGVAIHNSYSGPNSDLGGSKVVERKDFKSEAGGSRFLRNKSGLRGMRAVSVLLSGL